MDLSIIIVNWHSADFLRGCLRSLFATVSGLSFEVMVIDSGSDDGCGEMIAREFPAVKFIGSKVNLGFPKANNLAFGRATGDAILFLNPDTELRSGAVSCLWRSLQESPHAAIVGGRLLNTDGTVQTSCIQAFPTILNQALDSDWLRRRFPRARIWGTRALYEAGTEPREVDLVSGACLMIKREVFEQVGRFSTYCFMYAEDVDLCFKAREAGWKTYYVPQAVLVHHGGGSSARSVKAFSAVMARESLRRFFKRRRGTWYARGYRAALALVAMQRCLLLGCACLVRGWAGSRRTTSYNFRKWLAILRWTVGRETWVRNYA